MEKTNRFKNCNIFEKKLKSLYFQLYKIKIGFILKILMN